jgi:hypothetical protein
VFCAKEETIQHLFFECHFAKFIWIAVHVAFNVDKPVSVLHPFNDWSSTGYLKNQKLWLTGVATLIWAMWTGRNNLVFDNVPTKKLICMYYFEGRTG